MALTNEQDIPEKPKVKEPWTKRRLFPFAGGISSLTKIFVNPFDVMLGYLVFILGAVELFGRHVSWAFWLFTILILFISFIEKYRKEVVDSNEKIKDKEEIK